MKIVSVVMMVMAAGSTFVEGADAWRGKIRKDHPRMFINAESWPTVKARALGAERANWEKMLKQVEAYPDQPTCSGMEAVVYKEVKTATGTHKTTANTPINTVQEWGDQAFRCAFAWKMTGKPEYLEKARKMLEVSIAAYGEAYKNRRAVCWYSTSRVLALTAYDWIYEGLSDDQRRALIVPLLEHVEAIQPGPGKPAIVRRNTGNVSTGFYGVLNLPWFAGLAACGDGYCDELAEKLLKSGYEMNQQLLAFRSDSAGDDGGLSSAVPGYSMGAYPWAHFNFMHTWLSATGENLAVKWPNLALFPNWIFWNWIPNFENPDGQPLQHGFGDTTHVSNELETWLVYQHMTQYMHFFRGVAPEAARLAASLRGMVNGTSLMSSWPMIPFLMTSVDDVVPYSRQELETLPWKARHFESLGEVFMRSGWQPESTYCLFTTGARLTQHKHHDENNFVIYKKGFLALDSGTRGRETDYNLRYYYAQTVAHNCVLIHQPGEPMPSYWGMPYNGPEGKINHGGMKGFAGRTLAFQTNDAFTYVAGDATKAYGKKCTEAVRQFVHLQPDVFVVYDRVGAAEASYRKEWLLHTQNRPDIQGRVLRADENQGRLFCETLLPAGAELHLEGGPGREFWASGRNWEIDGKVLEANEKRREKTGKEALYGKWRLEVRPKESAKDDRFLHVLTACEQTVSAAPVTRLLQTDDEDGVEIGLPDGRTATVLFNRIGEVGGKLVICRGEDVVCAGALNAVIQPQAGVGR